MFKKTSDINKEAEIHGGLPILGIVPGSTADEFGICRGDILLEVNGQTISSMDDYIKAIENRKEKMNIKYIHNNQIIENEIVLRSISKSEIEKSMKTMANNVVPEEDKVILN